DRVGGRSEMIIERTCYYAKPGRAQDVLRTRRKASAVRVRLGLAAGSIFTKAEPTADGPDVAWECVVPPAEAHAQDLAARAGSPEFEAVRGEMTALLARFERQVTRRDGDGAAGAPEARPVVPQELRFRSGPLELAGYLYTPPGPGPFPCVVTNHGSTIQQGTADVCRPGTAALLMDWGYASFLPHRRGYGNSPGPSWRIEVTGEFGTAEYGAQLARRLEAESEDVVAALELLERRPEVAPGRVAVLGSSFGGTVSLLAGARCARCRCVADF